MDFFEKNARFKPIIHYFGKLLDYPGAVCDLWEHFWYVTLIHGENLPDFYYKKSIRNEYIRLSKIESLNKSELIDYFVFFGDGFEVHFENRELLKKAFDLLTEKQRSVLRRHSIEGYTIAEIAAQEHSSRQAVARIRQRALSRMRQSLDKIRL